jgi:hypothetical protein
VLAAVCLAIVACGEDPPASPTTPPGPAIPPGVERVTGSERLGWDQQASNSQELGTFRYLVYVDAAAPTDIQGVLCASVAGPAGFACTGRLPSMTAGQHSLRISSYIDSGGTRLESSRSEPLNVFMVIQGATALSSPAASNPSIALTPADGVERKAQVVADGLEEPVDLAFAPDGSVFIAERAGRIRVWRAGRLIPEPAVSLSAVAPTGGGGLLPLSIDPQF